MEQKLCRICGDLKNIDNFSIYNKMSDGYRNECKECTNKLYNNKERRREINLQKEIKLEGNKVCRICKENKPFDDYHLKIGTPDGHRHECKECVKEIQKKYKEADGFKEKDREYQKKRYDENRDKILLDKKNYHIENRDEILKKKAGYRNNLENKERTKEYLDKYRIENREKLRLYIINNPDINSKHQANYRSKYPHIVAWRSVLYSTLKRLGTLKEGHTIDMLGYSALDLKSHLENLFVDGMTWKNHGDWHIDHIKAVSNFDDTADIKVVCALENLQPLWAFDNLSKNNR